MLSRAAEFGICHRIPLFFGKKSFFKVKPHSLKSNIVDLCSINKIKCLMQLLACHEKYHPNLQTTSKCLKTFSSCYFNCEESGMKDF